MAEKQRKGYPTAVESGLAMQNLAASLLSAVAASRAGKQGLVGWRQEVCILHSPCSQICADIPSLALQQE